MSIRLVTREEVILSNKITVDKHGGNFVPPENIHNPNPLAYLLEAVDAEMFGEKLYPSVSDKAAFYMFQIISNHVFTDGNKRTGLHIALYFLIINGFRLKPQLSFEIDEGYESALQFANNNTQVLINFTLEVAAGQLSLDEVRNWFAENIEPRS